MILNAVVGNTETTLITAIADTAIVSIIFYNAHPTNNATITVYAYPQGFSGDDSTTLFKVEILPEDTFIWGSNEKLLVQTDAKVSVKANTAGIVTATINYLVI